MTDLLPIVFTRGQNESVDPRVAPPDVHAIAKNVRWRKDGRPSKRYGVAAVTTTGLATRGFNTQPANAITTHASAPLIAIGSRVSKLSAVGWSAQVLSDDGEIAHWGPGSREVVVRDENIAAVNATSGFAKGMVLHVWESASALYYSVKTLDGSVVLPPQTLGTGNNPRCVSTTNFIYILYRTAAGTVIVLLVFDPTTLAVSAAASPGTLTAANCEFDAIGRGSDFVFTYQSGPATIAFKIVSAIAAPVVTVTSAIAVAGAPCRLGIVGNATSAVFVAWLEPGTGRLLYTARNNSTLAALGGGLLDTDANNSVQPGVVLENNTTAQVVWGGFIGASTSSYMRSCQVLSAGAGASGPIGLFYNVTPVSKPFMGPAYSQIGNAVDGGYIWVATHNGNAGGTKWDSQRAYYLVQFFAATKLLRRQMHAPNAAPPVLTNPYLVDAFDLGVGYGFMSPLMNAVRFGNGIAPMVGVDTVTCRSIFESARMAARDTAIAGRVIQFSGGSLFEYGGVAEETGFSNFPVIQSIVGGGGGALSPGNYIYRAVYEYLDGQGRRHRSAASDPFLFATGANTSATLTLKPLVADSHGRSSAGAGASGVTIHVYRTLVGQSAFRRVTPNVGAPPGSFPSAATVPFVDLMADSVAAEQEVLYTDGGVADNTLCPPHTFHTVCSGRLWVGGQLDRTVTTASKWLVDGEPTQFSDLEEFSVPLPQECTGIASIDGTVVAFAREKIYLITGDGPNDQGIGSFNPPTELPTDVGCVDWRSVVETSVGVFFLSKRGIYLLPRGFNSPIFIGAEVEATLALYPYIVSATAVSIPSRDQNALGEITVRFVVSTAQDAIAMTTTVLVYDIRTGGWSVDELGDGPLLSGTWGDSFITSRSSAGVLTLQSENASSGYASYLGTYLPTSLGTADIRPFGIAGYGQFNKVVLLGEFRGSSFVNVSVSVDGATADTYVFPVTAADAPDDSVCLDVTPKIQKGTAIRVTCFDGGNPNAANPTEGFIMQALFIEHELIGKTKRLASARKA